MLVHTYMPTGYRKMLWPAEAWRATTKLRRFLKAARGLQRSSATLQAKAASSSQRSWPHQPGP